jgi:molybdate transport system ATP-binding protein
MDSVRLRVDIERRLASFDLRVRLEVRTEILVLFGPSGAGKTQTLNAIAGLVAPDAGEITLGETTFFRSRRAGPSVQLPARKRHIGYVFQSYALFPHVTALENVAYALWRQRHGRQRAWSLLERMRLVHLAHHYPHQLSGGQQQRVAIARALAAEPEVLLLDEPFAALDMGVRESLQQDIQALQRESALVVIYVTHNLDDALAIGHRLAVMREGQVEQVGPIETVTRQPASDRVLEILGIPNVFSAKVLEASPAGLRLDWDGVRLEAPFQPAPVGEMVRVYIRPEDVKILYPDRPLTHPVRHNQVVGRIASRRLQSSFQTLIVSLTNGRRIEVTFPTYAYTPLSLAPGEDITLCLRKEGLVLLPLIRPDNAWGIPA